MTSANTATICSGGTVSVTLTSNVASTYTWIAANNANITGESLTTQSTSTLSNTLTNSSASVQNVIYTVTPTSSTGSCIGASQTITVTVNSVLVAGAHNTTTLSACVGYNPANLTFTTPQSGGQTPYTYQWLENSLAIASATLSSYDPPVINVAGTYSYNCVVTDGCGNSASTVAKVITILPDPSVSAQPAASSTICLNSSFTLTTLGSGGTPSLTYQWYANNINSNSTGTPTLISGATSSNYSVSTSAIGTYYYYCIISASGSGCGNATSNVSVVYVKQVLASVTSTNVNCFGVSNGIIDLTVSGGTSPYTYAWSNSATSQDLSGLSAGSYSVLITDATGCNATASVTITQPTALVASVNITTPIACNGGNAVVTVSATGGTGAYTGTGTFTVAAGNYTYTVTDANGCTKTTTINVAQPTLLVASSAVTSSIACNGGDAVVTVSATGGTGAYTGTGTFTVAAEKENSKISN